MANNLYFHSSSSYRHEPFSSDADSSHFFVLELRSLACPVGYDSSSHTARSLRVIGCGPGMLYSAESLQVLKEMIFKLPTLVVMYLVRKSKGEDKVVENLICCCSS